MLYEEIGGAVVLRTAVTVLYQRVQVNTEAFDRLTDHLTGVLRDLGVAPTAVAEVGERLDALRDLVVDEGAEPAESGVRAEGGRAR